MAVTGNTYTVAQINKAVKRAQAAVSNFIEGSVSPATIQLLIELYLGAIDADKETE